MTSSTTEPSADLRPARSLARWIRQVHFYASMALAGLILFFASTGFLGNRADLLDTKERALQRQEGTLPEDLALEAQPLAAWFSNRFPGKLLAKSVETDDSTLRFEMESVWSWHEVTVNRNTRTYTVNTTPSTKISSLVGLHRGKWAGPTQRLLVDLTALALMVATCTGVYIGVTHPVRSRRWAAIGLLAGSMVLILMLCLNR